MSLFLNKYLFRYSIDKKKLVNNNTFEKPEILFINSIYYHLLDEIDEKKIYIDKKKIN